MLSLYNRQSATHLRQFKAASNINTEAFQNKSLKRSVYISLEKTFDGELLVSHKRMSYENVIC